MSRKDSEDGEVVLLREEHLMYWMNVLLCNNELDTSCVDFTTIKDLTFVSTKVSKIARGYVQSTFWFPENKLKGLKWYSPRRIKGINELLPDAFPPVVTHLIFATTFNAKVDHLIPNTVTFIRFGFSFSKPIGKNALPPHLTQLYFGYWWNESISEVLPAKLTHLQFGLKFNRAINNQLPPSLERLEFGSLFNMPVSGLLPNKITQLIFGDNFDQVVSSLPPNLIFLKFGTNFHSWPLMNLPHSLQQLILGSTFNLPVDDLQLLQNLTHITFGAEFV
eukprot:TRINITY_DN457_c0_g1_i3.p1 TRINITY_DN457_c0_g1~~TRINITY_DN457_c0_g1_i3.p1  ORF type:complete len:277 (-),score=26.19 TRINITY_DN457_c0_g1_i3:544-1374(-)